MIPPFRAELEAQRAAEAEAEEEARALAEAHAEAEQRATDQLMQDAENKVCIDFAFSRPLYTYNIGYSGGEKNYLRRLRYADMNSGSLNSFGTE